MRFLNGELEQSVCGKVEVHSRLTSGLEHSSDFLEGSQVEFTSQDMGWLAPGGVSGSSDSVRVKGGGRGKEWGTAGKLNN